VLESPEGAYFAGFIAGSALLETGPRVVGNTRYSKGVAAFQAYCVEKKFGKVPWLRTGGMDALMMRLSQMKGFTKEHWGLRGTLAALFRMVDPVEVTNLKTYLLPRNEVMKHIKTKLPCENGGLFRPEEITYLTWRYSSVKSAIEAFLLKVDNPTEDFAKDFSKEYTIVKTGITKVESEIRLLSVNRARVLFPPGQKKATKKFRERSLELKIEDIIEKHDALFAPESLPGIQCDGTSERKFGCLAWRKACYSEYAKDPVKEVIDSWYTIVLSSEEE